MSEVSTKQRILDIGLELFSQKGFKATSIRKISEAAQVNISAISYYFSSKQQLYTDIIMDSKRLIRQEIEKLYDSQESWKSIEFVDALTDLFYNHNDRIAATFKIIIDDQEISSEAMVSEDNPAGPPGVEFIEKVLLNEFSEMSQDEASEISYITQCYIIHKCVLANTLKKKNFQGLHPCLVPEYGKDFSTSLIKMYMRSQEKK